MTYNIYSQNNFLVGNYTIKWEGGLWLEADEFQLYENMAFDYQSHDNCTMTTTTGLGEYEISGNKLILNFQKHPKDIRIKHKYRIDKLKNYLKNDSIKIIISFEDSLLAKLDSSVYSNFKIVFEGESYFKYTDEKKKFSKHNIFKFDKDFRFKQFTILGENEKYFSSEYLFYTNDSISTCVEIYIEQFLYRPRQIFVEEGQQREFYIEGRWLPEFKLVDLIGWKRYRKNKN